VCILLFFIEPSPPVVVDTASKCKLSSDGAKKKCQAIWELGKQGRTARSFGLSQFGLSRLIPVYLLSHNTIHSTEHYSSKSAEQAQIIEFLLSDYPSGLCAVKFSHSCINQQKSN
jgi:hypothetical protein